MIYKLVSDKLLSCLKNIVGKIECAVKNGTLSPQMTNTQRNALTPTEGQMIYSLTDHAYEYWNGTTWKQIATV